MFDIARFFMKLREEDCGYRTRCWLWTGGNNGRYGQFYIEGGPQRATRTGRIYAHRFAYCVAVNDFAYANPAIKVCHHCDQPLCARFDHLFTGTQADNLLDAASKGRMDKKLTRDDRLSIATRHLDGGESQASLAVAYGVERSLISYYCTRERNRRSIM